MTTTTAPRPLTARQLAKALAEIDTQLAGLRAIEAGFWAAFPGGEIPEPVREPVSAAWYAAIDAVDALKCHRDRVERNTAPTVAGEYDSRTLAQANID